MSVVRAAVSRWDVEEGVSEVEEAIKRIIA